MLYITQPDCPIWSNCGSEDGEDDDEGGWGWKDVLGTIVDFTPIIGDAKGIWEAIKDPTPVNIIAAGVGLAGPWGDAAAKGLKAAAKAKRALGADVASGADDLVDLTSAARRRHILDGDETGGGHRAGTGIPGKTEFPGSWSDDEIIHEISDIATDPSAVRTPLPRGGTLVDGTRNGVDIRVVLDSHGNIVTGYPTNMPKNP